MERFCFFCVKNCEETSTNVTSLDPNSGENENSNGIKPSRNELFKKFSKFIERYLKDSKGSKKWNFGELIDCCDTCAKTVSLICDLYHDLKTVELLVNWQLWTLNKLMADADKAPSKLQNYEEYLKKGEDLNSNDSGTPLEELLEVRKDFVKNCKGKLLGSYPKLVLSKYSQQNQEESNLDQSLESLPPSPCLSAALSCVKDENDCSVPETSLLEAPLAEKPSPFLDIKPSLESKKTTEISPPSKPANLKRKNSLDRKTKLKSRRRNDSGTFTKSSTTNLKKLKSKLQKKTVRKYEARSRKEGDGQDNDSEAIIQFQKEVKLEMNEDKLDKEEAPKENENVPPSSEDERDSDYEMKDAESDLDTDYSSEEEKLNAKKKKKTGGSNNAQPKRIRRSNVPIKCSYCEGTFTIKANLRRHILRKHKEKLATAVQDSNICSRA